MQIVKNSAIYLGSSIFSKMIPFLLLPIMTKYLNPTEYGVLSLYLVLITLYSAFIGMAIHTNISKNFFKVSKKELSIYIGNIFYILLFTFTFTFFITYLSSFYFDSLFSIPINWIMLIPFISIMLMINEINTTILRNERRAYMFGIFEIFNIVIKMGLTILFLLLFSMGWYSQILGTFIGSMMFFIIGLIYMYKRSYITMQYSKEKINSILNISLPLIPHVLGSTIITVSDRFFIEKMIDIEAVGIYSVGYMFGMIVMLFSNAFIKAWSPWFYKSLVNPTESKKQKIVKYTYIYIFSIIILSIVLSVVGKIILPYIVDEKFYEASKFIFWIALSYAIFGIYQIYFPYLVYLNKTSFLAISTVSAAILNLLFNYFFIKEFGALGATYATIIAYIVSASMVAWYQSKLFNMPWLIILKKFH